MNHLSKLAIAISALAVTHGTYAAKSADGEKIDLSADLSAIEARLDALEALNAGSRLSDLETTSYEGTYTVTIMEAQHWGWPTCWDRPSCRASLGANLRLFS
jgi:hypothetical protein